MLCIIFQLALSVDYKLVGSHATISGSGNINRAGVLTIGIEIMQTCIINEGITGILSGSFQGCKLLKSITFPSTLSIIEASSFRECYSLTFLDLPSGLNSITVSYLLYGSTAIKKISVPNDNIKFSTYDDCLYSKDFSRLIIVPPAKDTISFHNNVQRLCTWCLYKCSIPSISFPDTITYIENMVIVDATYLTSISFSATSKLETISESAFWNGFFTKFILPPCVQILQSSTFRSNKITQFGFHPGSNLKKLIGAVFQDSTSLLTIHLPATVTEISSTFFSGCTSLVSVTIETNDKFFSKEGSLYSETQVIFLSPKSTTFSIGPLINSISQSMLQACQNLLNVEINNNTKFQYYNGVVYTNNFINASYALGGVENIKIKAETQSIDSFTFSCCVKLKTVTFESQDNLLYVMTNAFSKCSLLESVTFPPTLKLMQSLAFASSNIKTVNIARDLEEIAVEVFVDCQRLSTVTFDEGCKVKIIQRRAFQYNYLSNLGPLPPKLEIIYDYAFDSCQGIQSLSFPPSLKLISDRAFQYCPLSSSITFDGSTVEIKFGQGPFYNCKKLKSVSLPGALRSVTNGCFSLCSLLDTVTWNGTPNLQSIEDSAFSDTALSSFSIPSTTVSIRPSGFMNCFKLIRFELPDGSNTFNVSSGIIYNSLMTTLELFPPGLDSAFIQQSIESIANNAFYNAMYLSQLTFDGSANLAKIGEQTFAGCSSLKRIDFPSKLSMIYSNAFQACEALSIITFADDSQLMEIGESTFSGCSSLTYLSFGARSHLQSIGPRTFSGCQSLLSIQLPSSVSELGEEAFSGCTRLAKVDFEEGNIHLNVISDGVFSGCSNLSSIQLPPNIRSIGASAFESCIFEEFIVNDNVTSIGAGAFRDCSKLKSINIPKGLSLSSIASEAFSGCVSLSAIIYCGLEDARNYQILFPNSQLTRIDVLEVYPWNTAFGSSVIHSMKHCGIYITPKFSAAAWDGSSNIFKIPVWTVATDSEIE